MATKPISSPVPFIARKLLDEVLSKRIRPQLSPLGFKRKGHNFSRYAESRYDVISFQMNRWGTNADGSVEIIAGIFFSQVELLANPELCKHLPPPYHRCPVRGRFPMPGKRPQEWKLTSATDPEWLATALFDAIKDEVLPWFADRSTLESVYAPKDFREVMDFASPLAALVVDGKKDQAQQRLDDHLRRNGSPEVVERIRELATRLGLGITLPGQH